LLCIHPFKYTCYSTLEVSIIVKNSYADDLTELKKKRAFRKFSYRGVDLDQYVRTWLVSNELKP